MAAEKRQIPAFAPWGSGFDLEPARRHDTAVILHLFYPELWSELLGYLCNVEGGFDLFVTIPNEVTVPDSLIQRTFPDAYVLRGPNRGRDIAPFLAIFSVLHTLGYKYICKVHAKKDLRVKGGLEWRHDMLGKLLGSPKTVSDIKQALDQNPSWGIVGPGGHVVPQEYFWPRNAAHVTDLARAAGIPVEGVEFLFVGGTMFWFKPEALALALKPAVVLEDFESEGGQLDGTLAHAYERFFGLAASAAGYQVVESGGQGVHPADISFHFRLLYDAYEQAQSLRAVNEDAVALKSRLEDCERQRDQLAAELEAVKRGRVWRLGMFIHRWKERLLGRSAS